MGSCYYFQPRDLESQTVANPEGVGLMLETIVGVIGVILIIEMWMLIGRVSYLCRRLDGEEKPEQVPGTNFRYPRSGEKI